MQPTVLWYQTLSLISFQALLSLTHLHNSNIAQARACTHTQIPSPRLIFLHSTYHHLIRYVLTYLFLGLSSPTRMSAPSELRLFPTVEFPRLRQYHCCVTGAHKNVLNEYTNCLIIHSLSQNGVKTTENLGAAESQDTAH